MILTDREILKGVRNKTIVISPFRKACLGTNSYDVHLGKTLGVYRDRVLDPKKELKIDFTEIPDEGFVLQPGELYLGVTEEYTETHKQVPFLEGKSSTGRLGIEVHSTAGKGDVGFCNHWTLEISVKRPVKIYKGMPIAQIIYFKVKGKVNVPYNLKKSAKYSKRSFNPEGSKMWWEFRKGGTK